MFGFMQPDHHSLRRGWDSSRLRDWREQTLAKGKIRDYRDVFSRITSVPDNTHSIETYGEASGHPLLRISVGDTRNGNPNLLIIGGVHGYEPSGVEAAMQFAEEIAPSLSGEFNSVIYPCVSPWSYEYDQRWNEDGEDPNSLFSRKLVSTKPYVHRTMDIAECRHFMTSMEQHNINFACAVDGHETSDRDIELRLLRAERFDEPLAPDWQSIPQGYYLIMTQGNSEKENALQLSLGRRVIDAVAKTSPIAPGETIMNGKINHGGIIFSPPAEGLLRTYLQKHAQSVFVTEVYPDHAEMDFSRAVQAQIASYQGAIETVRERKPGI